MQPKGLLATEAFVTLPFGDTHPLAICSHFFEFIADDATVLRAHELNIGQTYEVIVTTDGGLWRYRLGDRVEVTGMLARTPTLRFLGRSGQVSDLRGEKLSEAFVARALAAAVASIGKPPRFLMLAPSPASAPPHYTLFLESDFPPLPFAAAIEQALRENPHYALCRDLGQLGPARVQAITGGGYERYTAAEISRGARLGEIKPVALSLRADWHAHLAVAPNSHEFETGENPSRVRRTSDIKTAAST